MKFVLVESIEEKELNEVYPNKGESKDDFISRFMYVTKDEYPDQKQRYAVALSYWDRRNKKKVRESLSFEIEDGLNNYISITDNVPVGSSYLLRDGRFIDLNLGTHASFVRFCKEEGYDFSPYRGLIRLNNGKMEELTPYIDITHKPNEDEYASIEKFIDDITSDSVEVNIDGKYATYSLKDYIAEDVIKRIKRYYSSGNLYERKVESYWDRRNKSKKK